MKWVLGETFQKIERILTVLMNLSVIVVLFVGLCQLKQSENLEGRQVALEAIGRTRTVEFLGAFGRIQQQFYGQSNVNEKQFLNDLNHVVVIYDYIALLYLQDIADKGIIKDAVGESIKDLIMILDGLKDIPKEFRANVDRLALELVVSTNH